MFKQINALAVKKVSTVEGFTDQNKKPNIKQEFLEEKDLFLTSLTKLAATFSISINFL